MCPLYIFAAIPNKRNKKATTLLHSFSTCQLLFPYQNKAPNFILQEGKAECLGSKMRVLVEILLLIIIQCSNKKRQLLNQEPWVTSTASCLLQTHGRFLTQVVEAVFFFRRYRRKTIKALFGLIFLDTLWISSKEKRTCYLNKASFSKSVLSFALWRQTFLHSCKEAKAFFWYEGDNCHPMSFPRWSLQWEVEGKDLKCTVVQCSKGKLQREKRRAEPFGNNFKLFQSHNQAFLM